jgi:hypothetical protein
MKGLLGIIAALVAVLIVLALLRVALKLIVIGLVVVAVLALYGMVRDRIGGGGAR